MIFLMNIHIYNMFYICTLYFVPEINLFVFVFKTILQMYDINSKSLLFIFYIIYYVCHTKICILVIVQI